MFHRAIFGYLQLSAGPLSHLREFFDDQKFRLLVGYDQTVSSDLNCQSDYWLSSNSQLSFYQLR